MGLSDPLKGALAPWLAEKKSKELQARRGKEDGCQEAAWERGANENMNGLIRQFFPKKMKFDDITDKDIAFATHRLNHRPRKCLGYKTPHEVFMKQLHSRHSAVALQT